MKYQNNPVFVIKENLQKSKQTGESFKNQITDDALKDICYKLTGLTTFDVNFVDNDYQDEFLTASYNHGRLAILQFQDEVYFITFSEIDVRGRNQSVQSVPTAFNIFYMCPYTKKHLCYYFIAKTGNPDTNYHRFIYQLMVTIGFQFLNKPYNNPTFAPVKLKSVEDLIIARDLNRTSNSSNNSTYVDIDSSGQYEAFCKTYGASKYESSLICYAMSAIVPDDAMIQLYQIIEGNLTVLPEASTDVLKKMGKFNLIETDMEFEKHAFSSSRGDTLRSPQYQYNLHERLGRKRCAFCGCEIPEVIQGAHIWPVAEIRADKHLTLEEKIKCAIDGDNGLWLCENHHKLFDRNILKLNTDGELEVSTLITKDDLDFVENITPFKSLNASVTTSSFIHYLNLRNRNVLGSLVYTRL